MGILCGLFGHKTNERVYSGAEYVDVVFGPIDGIGREHATLYGKCPRCEGRYRIGQMHRPQEWQEKK